MCLFLYLQFSKQDYQKMTQLKHVKFLILGILFACSNPNSPENISKEFYEAVQNKDLALAKELVTEESKTMMDLVGDNLNLTLKNGNITNVDCVTENDVSNCDCFIEGHSKPMPLSLLKEEGAWKVDIQSSAVNALDNLLDKFKDIDVNGILEKVGNSIDVSSKGINELIDKIDVDKVLETIEGMDSAVLKTDKSIESLIDQFAKGLK